MIKQRNVELACSANGERVFSSLDQSGVSNFALEERKIKKNFLLLEQISIKKNCPLYYIVIVIVDGQFAANALKIYITAERLRNW